MVGHSFVSTIHIDESFLIIHQSAVTLILQPFSPTWYVGRTNICPTTDRCFAHYSSNVSRLSFLPNTQYVLSNHHLNQCINTSAFRFPARRPTNSTSTPDTHLIRLNNLLLAVLTTGSLCRYKYQTYTTLTPPSARRSSFRSTTHCSNHQLVESWVVNS